MCFGRENDEGCSVAKSPLLGVEVVFSDIRRERVSARVGRGRVMLADMEEVRENALVRPTLSLTA